MECKFCGKICANPGGLKRHENCCKNNPDRVIKPKSEAWLNAMKNRRGSATNQYSNSDYQMSDETRKKLSDAGKQQVWSEERRQKHSERMKEVVESNPESYSASNVSGRVKNYEINGMTVKGTWELTVAEYLNEQNIKWTNKLKPIPYEWNNKWHLYFPDFYLPDLNLYIEVKGYERDRDKAKWKALDNLIILKEKEIKQIRNGSLSGISSALIKQ